ncbi:MAG: tRNA (guanosine(46)-N7)-methyltransferase TrmB [Lachnospiraceae bacterium]|nr:tRNA (guanosine(46)-N7)-methyltransferase TrmB [Lachnospiraceae bacterium]
MRLRHIKGAEETIAANKYVVQDPTAIKGKWSDFFREIREDDDDHPLHIEVGMGKGRFIMDMAEANPDINYIGIEMYSSVLLRGLQKMEERDLNNLRFLRIDARYIEDAFAPGEADRIYLNFSDPWPKDRHAKRRLPSRQFLNRFHNILNDSGTIEFKTDNRDLFDFALEEIAPGGFEPVVTTFDLHADEELCRGNIMTEYEEKFSSIGNPICKYVIRKNNAT